MRNTMLTTTLLATFSFTATVARGAETVPYETIAVGEVTKPVFGGELPADLGQGAKLGGLAMSGAGVLLAGLGSAMAAANTTCNGDRTLVETGGCRDEWEGGFWGVAFAAGGVALVGAGTGWFLRGRARSLTEDSRAKATTSYRWIGWALLGAGGLVSAFGARNDAAAYAGLGLVGSSLVPFAMSMWRDEGTTAITSDGDRHPFVSFGLLPSGKDQGSRAPALVGSVRF